jgi:hypothetical protein
MPAFTTNDGETFIATDAKDLVKQMAAQSFGSSETGIMQYMRDVASRSQRAASVAIRHDNVDNFVADMLMHNLLKVEN